MQPDNPVLKYPEEFALHPTITLETAANMLLRAIQTSQNLPYHWTFIDKPQDGQIYLLFMPNPAQPLNDGIRWQDQEHRYTMPVQRGVRDIEVTEVKYGFIPNSQDTSAWRSRRRYRLLKGGHPQLVLVHYSRAPSIQIIPSLMNSPVRQYPLRHITEPPVYVIGAGVGVGIHQSGVGVGVGGASAGGSGSMGVGVGPGAIPIPIPPVSMTPQAMIAQQNNNMEALERRRDRERDRTRARSGSMGMNMGGGVSQRSGPPRLDDDESADESETLSTRTLALTRYRRNHELMEQVFKHAAFGMKNSSSSSKSKRTYEGFDKSELEAKAAKLRSEVQALQTRAEERRARKAAAVDEVLVGASGHGHALMEVAVT